MKMHPEMLMKTKGEKIGGQSFGLSFGLFSQAVFMLSYAPREGRLPIPSLVRFTAVPAGMPGSFAANHHSITEWQFGQADDNSSYSQTAGSAQCHVARRGRKGRWFGTADRS
jgi:hypothetical protein